MPVHLVIMPINRLFSLLIILLAATTAVAVEFGNSEVDGMYRAILDTGGLRQKERQGQALGAVGTPSARRALTALLEDSHYWNRRAGAIGLFQFTDAESQALLIDHLLRDHMIAGVIERNARRHWPAFFPAVKQAYGKEQDEDKRHKLLELIHSSEEQAGVEFLKSIVEQPGSPDREFVYRRFSRGARTADDAFLRGYWSDRQLQPAVMDYLLAHGNAADMQRFRPYLEPWQGDFTLKAYAALNQWGSPEEKEKRYFAALSSNDSLRLYGALVSFTGVRSERVLERLAAISENNPSQTIRRLACLGLLYFHDQRIVPYLERFLEEPYMPREQDGWDVLMTQLSLGTTALFHYLDEREKKKEFEKSREKLMNKLEQMR
jgi:PAS domain-containing protein